MSFQMQDGSLEWHKKRRAAKTTSHFIGNQIEDYKSSQKWNNSTRLGNSPVFFFLLKTTTLVFFPSLTTKELIPLFSRPRLVVFGILLGSGCTTDAFVPFQHVRLPQTARAGSGVSLAGVRGRGGTNTLGLGGGGTTTETHTGENQQGCFGLAKQAGWH